MSGPVLPPATRTRPVGPSRLPAQVIGLSGGLGGGRATVWSALRATTDVRAAAVQTLGGQFNGGEPWARPPSQPRPATAQHLATPRRPPVASGGAPSESISLAGDQARKRALGTVTRFYAALNARDIGALLLCVSDVAVLHDIAHGRSFVGQLALARFYATLMAALPPSQRFVMEDCSTGDHKVAVRWRLEAGTRSPASTVSSGVSFFGLDAAGRINSIRQAPDQAATGQGWGIDPLRVAGPLLSAGAAALPSLITGVAAVAGTALLSSGILPAGLFPNQTTPSSSPRLLPRTTGQPRTAQPAAAPPTPPPSPAAAATAQAQVCDLPPEAVAPAPARPLPLTALNGVWTKDTEASDLEAYERALDVWGIQGPQRSTARLIEGLEIRSTADRMSVNHLTIIPMFKVTEEYRLATSTSVMRRDLRPGQGRATLVATPKGAVTHTTWGAPHAGSLEEVYELLEGQGDAMAVTSTISVGGQTQATRAVWRRAAGTKDDLLKESEARHGSAKTLLRQMGFPV